MYEKTSQPEEQNFFVKAYKIIQLINTFTFFIISKFEYLVTTNHTMKSYVDS